MSYGQPSKSLDLARARLTPEQWAKFEADFEHFCAYSGLVNPAPLPAPYHHLDSLVSEGRLLYNFAKWAYLCGKGL